MCAQDALDLLNHAGALLSLSGEDNEGLDRAYDLIVQAMQEIEWAQAEFLESS